MPPAYLSRQDIIDRLHPILTDCDEAQTRDAIYDLLQEAKVTYGETVSREDKIAVARLVRDDPGLTYLQLAEQLDWSKNKVKGVVAATDRLEARVRKDLKGAFGRPPHGIYLVPKQRQTA